MNSREKAIRELMQQMREQRARLDPKLLHMARLAAEASHKGLKKEDFEPYDREAAHRTIALFLENHENPETFKQRLKAFLHKQSH